MPYLGQRPSKGDENNFKILDDISSYTLTFDGSDSSVVSAANETITSLSHRFVQGQRVTYGKGSGGTVIAGLTDATVYYIIKEDHNTIKLATSASNASNGVAVNITGVGGGSSHTLNVAFDGVNTKFKATHTNGQKAKITRSAQLVISINGVIQQPHDSATPSTGFGFDLDGTIVFSQAPVSTDIFWAHVLTNNNVTFDISDNDIDNFTGDGSTTEFNLSKSPPDNRNVLVTIDGVVQYPNDPDGTARAYVVVENVLTFNSAPPSGVEIQVRHIGFAGSSSASGGVTNFYGRTGSVVLKNTDNIVANNAEFAGNLTVQGTMTTLDTKVTEVDQLEVGANNTTVGVAITQSGSGDILKLYDGSSEVFTVATQGDGVGAVTISSPKPRIVFNETNASPDYQIRMNGGIFSIYDSTNDIGRISISPTRTDINNPVLINNDILYIGDKLVHWTDDDTAIRFPANDTISFTTSGSERVKIFSNGGTAISNAGSFPSSTNETLFIQGEGHNGHGTTYTRSVFNITAAMTSRPVNGGGGLWIGARTNEDTAVIGTRTANGNLAIETHSGGWGERLRITSSGNVGIGSVAPAALLNLMSSNPLIRLTDSDNGAYSAIGGESGFLYFYTHTSTRDFIFRGSEEVARITGDGMLGIGTHTPGQALHLIDNKRIALGQGQDLQLYHSGSTSYINNSTGILRITGANGQKIDFYDGSNGYYARFNSGNSCELHYVGSGAKIMTASYGATIIGNARASTGGDGYTFINDPDTGIHNPSDGNLRFKVNGVDRLSMHTSGISTFHNQKIHIEGAGSGNTPLTINTDVASNNSVNPLIEAYADNASYKAQIGLVRDGSSGALGWAFFNSNAGSTEEALRINSYGQVGINTTVPAAQFSIAIDSNNTNPLATGGIALGLKNTNTTDNSWVCMDFNNSVGGIVGRFGAQFTDTSDKDTDLYFANRYDGGVLTERLRIKSDGEIVIPAAGANRISMRHSGGGAAVIKNPTAANLSFGTNNQDQEFVITNGGKIYVGSDTTNFSDVGTFFNLRNNTYGGRIGFSNNTATAGVALMEQFAYWGTNKIAGFIASAGTDTSNKDDGELAFYTRYSGASVTEALRIKDDGEIRIRGVKSGNSVPNVVVTFDILNSNGDSKKAEIKATKTADITSELIFSTTVSHSFSERMRITSSGRVGINTTTDSMDGVTGNLNIANTNFNNHTVINLSRNTASHRAQIRFQNTNGNVGSIDTFGSDLIMSSGNDLKFYTNGTERLRIDSQGNVKSGTVTSALNFTDSNSGNTKSIEIGATSGGDALLVTHSSGYGVGYFGYEAGGDRLVIACDGGSGNNKIDFITSAGTSTGGGTDNLSGKVPRMRITSDGKVGINNTNPQTTLNVKGTISTGRNVAREVGTATASVNFNSSRDGENVINGKKNYENGSNDWLTPGHNRNNAYVTIDLGANYNISRAVIYNQNEYVNSRREVKGFTLEASTDNSNWTTVISDELGRSNGHEPNPGWSFRIPSIFNDDDEFYTARYWKFTMLTFHGSDPYGGIMEIELYEHSDSLIDEITSASVVAGDVYAETAAFKRITHDGGQKIIMDNAGANGVDAGISLGLDGPNSYMALGQVGESGLPMITKTYRINSPGNGQSATHVLMEATNTTNSIVMNGTLTIFPGRAGYNQQRGYLVYAICLSAYSGALYGFVRQLHRLNGSGNDITSGTALEGYSDFKVVTSGTKVQLEMTTSTAAVGRVQMIFQGQLLGHTHNY